MKAAAETPDSPGAVHRRGGRRALALAAPFALLLLAELALRALDSAGLVPLPRPATVRDAWAADGWTVDRHLNWRLIPEHTSVRGGAECVTNSRGLREEELPLAKPPGTYRILVLGDSTVLGFGVPLAARFSDRLEALLNQEGRSLRFETVNAGVPGYSLYNAWVYLQREGLRFEPDLLIVETNFNDRRLVAPEHADSEEAYARFWRRLRAQELLSATYLGRATRRALAGLGLVRPGLVDTGDFEPVPIDVAGARARLEPERYEALLDELLAFAAARGLPVVLVPLPDRPANVAAIHRAGELAAAGRAAEALAALEAHDADARLAQAPPAELVARGQRALEQGRGDDPALRELQRLTELPIYALVVARRLNALAPALGRAPIEHLPNPVDWNSTDGSLLVHLCEPYVARLHGAAARPGVETVAFDTRGEGLDALYLDYIHLNEAGHAELARRLHALVTTSGEIALPR
ncbi:MAG TPA: SGNH/GDSL hydrolase family protein [Planctomycetota bacterium]